MFSFPIWKRRDGGGYHTFARVFDLGSNFKKRVGYLKSWEWWKEVNIWNDSWILKLSVDASFPTDSKWVCSGAAVFWRKDSIIIFCENAISTFHKNLKKYTHTNIYNIYAQNFVFAYNWHKNDKYVD